MEEVKYSLTPEEDREMDFVCDVIIDLMLSDREHFLFRTKKTVNTEISLDGVDQFLGPCTIGVINFSATRSYKYL